MVGDTYTIVDMAFWGWARMVPFVLGDDAFAKYPNVKRLLDEVSARPAAARAIALKDKFTFKTEMDDEAKQHHVPPPQDQGGLVRASVIPGSGATIAKMVFFSLPTAVARAAGFAQKNRNDDGDHRHPAIASRGSPSTASTSAVSQYSVHSLSLPPSSRSTLQ